MSLLKVSGLTVRAGSRPVLSGIDLRLEPGERVGLVGESGSGKSVTCLSIMGLLPPELRAAGSIRLDGVEPDLLAAGERDLVGLRGTRMSMIFQEPMTALNPLMTVGRQVAETMTLHGRSDRRAAVRRSVELLDRMGLPDPALAAAAYPHQLSGGMRQRALLAMAMANSPDLLLADEPTTALDVTVQAQVLAIMRDQVETSGTTLLFITHDLAVVSGLCDRVMIMRDGAVVESGPIDRVFSRPAHPYTRALLAASALRTDPRTGRLVTVAGGPTAAAPRAIGAVEAPRSGRPVRTDHLVRTGDAPVVFNRTEDLPAVRVRALSRSYRRGRTSLLGPPRTVPALREVSFDVAEADRFGIVGESGSGKSTLLRLLCALDAPTAGTAELAGVRLAGSRERGLSTLREQVQMVFQDPHSSLDPRLRIRDVVAEPLRHVRADERRHRVEEMLAAVGLPPSVAGRYPHQFSGGQRQRIAIARALITRPRILLADEPVSALDVSVRAQILNLLTDLVAAYRLTLVLVSHDLATIRHLCRTVAVMQAGRIVECGPTDNVYSNPQHPYTRRLIDAVPTLRIGEEVR